MAIRIPNGEKLISGQEMAAYLTVKMLHAAEAQYYSTYGRYAVSLQELAKPTSGNPSASAAGLISGDLAKGEKQGYKYNLQGTPTGYTINADPVAFGISGGRTFFSDQSQEIHQHRGQEPATVKDFAIK